MKKYALLLLFMLGITFNSMAQSKSEASYRNYSKYYTLEKDGTLKERVTMTILINTHTAFNSLFGETFIQYNPNYQTITINHCYTIMENGTKVEIPENAMSEMLPRSAINAPAYNQLREIVISHTGLEIGSTIHLEYEIETSPEYTGGELDIYEIIPQKGIDMFWSNISVTIPKDKKLNWSVSESTSQPFRRESDSLVVYSWSFGRQDQLENLPNTSKHKGISRLYVSTRSFEESMAHMARTTRDMARLSPEIMADAKNDDDKINIIANHMKSMVELCDINPELINFKHHSPSEVDRRGYGTKADKAFLFDRLLSSEGLTSDIVVSYPIDCTAPNLNGYEEMYVMVTSNGQNKFYNVNGEVQNVEFIADRYSFYSVKNGKKIEVEFKENVGTFSTNITVNGNSIETKAVKNGNDVEAAAKLIDCGAYKMIQLPDSKLTDWGITRVNTERIVPIEIPSQQNLTENHIIKLENGQFVSKNKSVKIEHEIGSVVINITVEGNTAKIVRKLDMNSTVIQKSDILKMKEIVDAWNDDNLMRLIIK
jgi:hypothetical protein